MQIYAKLCKIYAKIYTIYAKIFQNGWPYGFPMDGPMDFLRLVTTKEGWVG